jgi:HSP20 family protein
MATLIHRGNRELARWAWDPFRAMDALLRWQPSEETTPVFAPKVDVKETKDGFVLSADLPGVKESDIHVSVDGSVLTISGHRDEEQRTEEEHYHAVERTHGGFSRSYELPETADLGGVKAELKNGVLTVQVGKKPEAQPRSIPVTS